MLYIKFTLKMLVKLIQLDITEQRQSKVANGKAAELRIPVDTRSVFR